MNRVRSRTQFAPPVAGRLIGPVGYTATAVVLHWAVAALICVGVYFGLTMVDMPVSLLKLKMYNWHKWIGMSVLALVIVRLMWRALHEPPAPVSMPLWQQKAAQVTHALLYLLMVVVPLTGWLYNSYAGYTINYFGVLKIPDLVAKSSAMAPIWKNVHVAAVWTLIPVVVLHVAAALKHHLIDHDGTLVRMLTVRPSEGGNTREQAGK